MVDLGEVSYTMLATTRGTAFQKRERTGTTLPVEGYREPNISERELTERSEKSRKHSSIRAPPTTPFGPKWGTSKTPKQLFWVKTATTFSRQHISRHRHSTHSNFCFSPTRFSRAPSRARTFIAFQWSVPVILPWENRQKPMTNYLSTYL